MNFDLPFEMEITKNFSGIINTIFIFIKMYSVYIYFRPPQLYNTEKITKTDTILLPTCEK